MQAADSVWDTNNNSWLGLMKVADYQPQGLKTISWLAWWIPFFFQISTTLRRIKTSTYEVSIVPKEE